MHKRPWVIQMVLHPNIHVDNIKALGPCFKREMWAIYLELWIINCHQKGFFKYWQIGLPWSNASKISESTNKFFWIHNFNLGLIWEAALMLNESILDPTLKDAATPREPGDGTEGLCKFLLAFTTDDGSHESESQSNSHSPRSFSAGQGYQCPRRWCRVALSHCRWMAYGWRGTFMFKESEEMLLLKAQLH